MSDRMIKVLTRIAVAMERMADTNEAGHKLNRENYARHVREYERSMALNELMTESNLNHRLLTLVRDADDYHMVPMSKGHVEEVANEQGALLALYEHTRDSVIRAFYDKKREEQKSHDSKGDK